VAFTVFFGDRPGYGERRRMDANGDGAVDPGEGRAFGERLRREIAGAVTVDVDGRRVDDWTLEDVGLGRAVVGAGAFSVDLVLRASLGEREGHTVQLEDRLALPAPGETQLRIDESPGVRLTEAFRDPESRGLQTTFDFTGNPAPARVFHLRFAIDPDLRPKPQPFPWIWAAAGLAAAGLAATWAVRRNRTG
jgi:hypothetical protein